LIGGRVGEGGGAALRGGERGAAGGRGEEEGPLAGESADGERGCAAIGEDEGLRAALAGGDLAEVEDALGGVLIGDDVAGDGEGGEADAVAFDEAEAVEGGGAVGGVGLREEGAGDVAVGEGEEGDVEVAGGRAAQAGPLRRNWRGSAMLRARDFDVRLLMVNWRVLPRVLVALGP